MQQLLPVNPDLPQGRRLADESLVKLHMACFPRGDAGKPRSTPHIPTSPKPDDRIVAIRADT
jgi:hypothetical protein